MRCAYVNVRVPLILNCSSVDRVTRAPDATAISSLRLDRFDYKEAGKEAANRAEPLHNATNPGPDLFFKTSIYQILTDSVAKELHEGSCNHLLLFDF